MMLADNLAYCAKFRGLAEVRPEPPDDFAVSSNNREKTSLPAADDHVVWGEAHISFVEPMVRPEIGCGVDMQPVETSSRSVDSRCRLDCSPGCGGKAELVDMIAGDPLPDDLAVWRHLNETIVLK